MKYKDILYEDSLIRVFKSTDGKTVLKQFPELANKKRIDNEYNNSLIIRDLPFNKAKILGRHQDDGKLGLVYEFIEGKKIRDLLEDLFYIDHTNKEEKLDSYAFQLASLHKDLLKCKAPNGSMSYKKNLKHKAMQSKIHTKDEKKYALNLIESLPDSETLCHGSLVPNNVIISKGTPYAIDFATITKGPAFFDIAKTYCATSQNYRKKVIEENYSADFKVTLKNLADLYLQYMGASWSDIKDYHYLINFVKTAYHGIR